MKQKFIAPQIKVSIFINNHILTASDDERAVDIVNRRLEEKETELQMQLYDIIKFDF